MIDCPEINLHLALDEASSRCVGIILQKWHITEFGEVSLLKRCSSGKHLDALDSPNLSGSGVCGRAYRINALGRHLEET